MRLRSPVLARWVWALSVTAVLSVPVSAWAGMLGSTTHALLYNATVWKGFEHYAGNAAIGANKVNVDVEYAVFTSARFQDFMDDNGLTHTHAPLTAAMNADELIYAYQVFNVADPTAPGVTNVQVGKDAADVIGSVSPPYYVNTGVPGIVVVPGSSSTTTSSMKWNYSTNDIDLGEVSPILIFSSPKLPEWAEITVNSGAAADPDDVMVPSPGTIDFEVPEPASIVLAVWTLGLCFLRQRRGKVNV